MNTTEDTTDSLSAIVTESTVAFSTEDDNDYFNLIENTTSDNVTIDNSTDGTPDCYAWLWEELRAAKLSPADITIDVLNEQFVRRNIGGIIMLSMLIVIGLIGNLHVLIIYKRRFGRSNYRIYVLWLAMLDILNCSVVAPLTIFYLFNPLTYPSDILCKIFRSFLYIMAIASTTSLVIIAVDMNKKIGNTFGTHFSFKQAKILCFVCVIVAFALSWPAPILYGNATVQTGIPGVTGKRCFTADAYAKEPYQGIFNLVLGVYFVVVSLTLVILYIRIGRNIQTSRRRFGRSIKGTRVLAGSEDIAHSRSRTLFSKTMWTLCIITVAYVLCALPYHTLALMIFIDSAFDCKLTLVESQLFYTFVWSYFINSAVNPFIYGLRDRKFLFQVKNIYISIISSCCSRRSTETTAEVNGTSKVDRRLNSF